MMFLGDYVKDFDVCGVLGGVNVDGDAEFGLLVAPPLAAIFVS